MTLSPDREPHVEPLPHWETVPEDVPAAIREIPWCPRNEEYAAHVRETFATGSSPGDFPEEHYERSWSGRFTPGRLNATGRRGLGLG